jgi:tetratricopeptide (TPR) repeat protein
MLGNAAANERDLERAQQLLDESVRAFREFGDEHFTLSAAFNLAIVIEDLGDRERARTLHEDILRRARELQDEQLEAHAMTQLGMIFFAEDQLQDASSTLAQALRIFRDHGNLLEIAINLGRFAAIFAREGRAATAGRLLSSSEALTEEIASSIPPWAATRNERTLTTIRGQLDEAALDEAWEQGRALTVDEAVALALDARD